MSAPLSHRVSFTLNFLFAVTVAALAWSRAQTAVSPRLPAEPAPADTPAARAPDAPESTPPGFAEDASPSERRRWLVDQLRAMGMPASLLARIVLADIEAAWTKHAAEIAKKCYGDPDTMAALQLEIDRTRDADLRAALGEEDFLHWDRENLRRESAKGGMRLASAEVEAAYGFWKQMQRREFELRDSRLKAELDDVGMGLEYEKTLALFDQQLKGLLGEERYAQAKQSNDDTARADLRRDFARAKPDSAQLEDLLRTQTQWNEVREELDREFEGDPSATAYADQLRMLDEARDNEYRRVLGTVAFEVHQKEQHPGYSMMKKNAALWGLDDREIDSVYASLKYYEKAVQDYQDRLRDLEARGQAVAQADASRNLEQFAVQTRQALQTYLGKKSFDQMQRNGLFDFGRNQPPRGAPLEPGNRHGG